MNMFNPFIGNDSNQDFNDIKNKPQINGVELEGNKSAADLYLASVEQANGTTMFPGMAEDMAINK